MKITEKAFLGAVKRADARFYADIRARIEEAAARKGKRRMEQQKRKRMIGRVLVGALIAAAVLGGGGIAVMTAMRGSSGIIGEESRDISSMVEIQSPLHLTDQEWNDLLCMGCGTYSRTGEWFWCAEGDRGWYHPQLYHTEIDTELIPEMTQDLYEDYLRWFDTLPAQNAVLYTDNETGETLPLCSRAVCNHDGNTFCEATTESYSDRSPMIYFEGQLLAVASMKNFSTGGYDAGYVLGYALDGTGIRQLAHFDVHPAAKLIGSPILHRGWLWAVYRDYSCYGEETLDTLTGDLTRQTSSGFVIWGYELQSGRTQVICHSMPAADEGIDYDVPDDQITAAGDRLFFSYDTAKWPSPMQRGIYAVNLVTGVSEKLPLKGSEQTQSVYLVNQNEVIYRADVRTEVSSSTPVYRLLSYSFETGESTELPLPLQEFAYIVQDGDYYITQRHETPEASEAAARAVTEVYDSAWNLVASIPRPMNDVYGDMKVHDGKLYQIYLYTSDADTPLQMRQKKGSAKLICCDLADLRAGNPQWETVLEFVTGEATYPTDEHPRRSRHHG